MSIVELVFDVNSCHFVKDYGRIYLDILTNEYLVPNEKSNGWKRQLQDPKIEARRGIGFVNIQFHLIYRSLLGDTIKYYEEFNTTRADICLFYEPYSRVVDAYKTGIVRDILTGKFGKMTDGLVEIVSENLETVNHTSGIFIFPQRRDYFSDNFNTLINKIVVNVPGADGIREHIVEKRKKETISVDEKMTEIENESEKSKIDERVLQLISDYTKRVMIATKENKEIIFFEILKEYVNIQGDGAKPKTFCQLLLNLEKI